VLAFFIYGDIKSCNKSTTGRTWPNSHHRKPVSQGFCRQLLEPFDSEGQAKDFWGEAPSIIILDSIDTITLLKQSDAIQTLNRDNTDNPQHRKMFFVFDCHAE
jgi:hypothetical protein